MHNMRPDIKDSQRDDAREGGGEQFPVDTAHVTRISFDTHVTNGDLVRIVVMNGMATTQCSPYREYHYGNAGISLEDVAAFTMRSGTLAVTQTAVDGFVNSMPLHLDVAQSPSWSRGVHSPSGARNRLYKAADPDDRTKMIGVLLEQDTQGALTQITWYKTQDARALFQSTPDALDFELVKDERGQPSLDPNDIAGWTWYYTTSIASGS